MSTCIECGAELPAGRRERCEECIRERRKATLAARRNGRDLGGYTNQPPAQPFALPPGCRLARIGGWGCGEGEGVQILGFGRMGVARDCPDLPPGWTAWVLR